MRNGLKRDNGLKQCFFKNNGQIQRTKQGISQHVVGNVWSCPSSISIIHNLDVFTNA